MYSKHEKSTDQSTSQFAGQRLLFLNILRRNLVRPDYMNSRAEGRVYWQSGGEYESSQIARDEPRPLRQASTRAPLRQASRMPFAR